MKGISNIKPSIIAVAGCCLIGVSSITLAVSCGDSITTAEVLDNDITNCAADPAITIIGPNGSLNLNNHNISCIGVGTGIFLDGMFANLTGERIQPAASVIAVFHFVFRGMDFTL
ncbi:hypothetical protein [Microbulbifer sp. VAAF005]|uniref:hypothetical protein n=1 Tax=Microbulbifer sp. VAAF005 TaxID=3034230 RepID=UPI0024AE3EEE|nr:hypothetical protein [Microbulbifer sp. VAAF005]WHI46058.1 hypothetical protein P0078_20425 [Microbulbifer sp. VAAF005]